MNRDDVQDCPEFHDERFEEILTWATKHKALVEWSDVFVNGEGTETHRPEWASWSLIWSKGMISFTHLPKKEDEAAARKTAALFIYLWSKGVSATIADRCASQYVLHVHVRTLK